MILRFYCPDLPKTVNASGDFCSPSADPKAEPKIVWGYGCNWSSGYSDHPQPDSLWNKGDGCVDPAIKGGHLDGVAPGNTLSFSTCRHSSLFWGIRLIHPDRHCTPDALIHAVTHPAAGTLIFRPARGMAEARTTSPSPMAM